MYVWWSKMTAGVRGEAVQPPAKCEVNHLTLARYRWSIQSAIPRTAARSRSATNRGAVIDSVLLRPIFNHSPGLGKQVRCELLVPGSGSEHPRDVSTY